MVSIKPRRLLALGSTLALVAALGMAPSAMATFPGRNGPITFMRQDDNGFWQTWVAKADLTHQRQVTNLPANSGWSAWSPDRSRIAINSDRDDPDLNDGVEVWDIFTMKPDGRGLVKLTDSIGLSGSPAYSPDGRLIAFEADRGDYPAQAGIYVMNALDGSHARRITSLPEGIEWDESARFSPDGRKLVFTRHRAAFTRPNGQFVDWGSALYSVRLDGSGLRRLTAWNLRAGDADWSPDGRHLVFEADLVDGRGDAWIVGSDGRGLRNVTWRPAVPGQWEGFSDPVFSPDGTLIVALHGVHFEDGSVTAGLASIHPDGTDLNYVADGLGIEHQVDWAKAKHH